jgi:hypothetical protein
LRSNRRAHFNFRYKCRETRHRKLELATQDSVSVQGEESSMRRKKNKPSRPTIEPQRWVGEYALTKVHHFNERGLTLMAESAQSDEPLAALWRQADERTLKRAARCPVLLVGLYFHRPDQWQRMTQRRGTPVATSAPAAPLLREILLEAWTLGRTTPRALNLLFGMASPVAATIVQLAAPDIDRIAIEEARHLKPRWPESRSFWKGLLHAAIGTDDQALANVHLHCLQLLGSEAMLP